MELNCILSSPNLQMIDDKGEATLALKMFNGYAGNKRAELFVRFCPDSIIIY